MSDAEKLAEDHVDWFLEIIRPLLLAEFIHGFKHGKRDNQEYLRKEAEEFNKRFQDSRS